MAVQIFKDSDCIYVEPERLQSHLDAGWSVEEYTAVVVKTVEVKDSTEEDEIKSKLDALGVKYHHKHKIEKLRELLAETLEG